MNEVQLAWLAGYLEGEGSFCVLYAGKKRYPCPKISFQTTDEDVAHRAAFLLDVRVSGPHKRDSGALGKKPYWQVYVPSYKAVRVMRRLLDQMGVRRREQIARCLKEWDDRTSKYREPGLTTACHPERKHVARGLCSTCYNKWQKANIKAKKLGALAPPPSFSV